MNDPRVVALHYRIEHESSVNYSKAEPVDHEEEGFRVRIEEGRACFVMKDDHPTVDSVLKVVNPYISSWELDAALTSKPNEFKLKFVRAEIKDQKPTPGDHRISADPVFFEFITSVATVNVRRQYPKPPVGLSLKRNNDVVIMLDRYEQLCNDRKKLADVAYFCLTMLEKLAGGRANATKKFGIERKVLNEVGELTDKKGGRAMARKAKGINQELTPGETKFLGNAVKVFIRRVAEEAQSPGGPFRKITIKDFSEVQSGTNKGCARV